MLRLIITTTRIEDGKEVDEDEDYSLCDGFDIIAVIVSYTRSVKAGQYVAFTATIALPDSEWPKTKGQGQ